MNIRGSDQILLFISPRLFRFPTDSNGEESFTYLSYQTLTVMLTFAFLLLMTT